MEHENEIMGGDTAEHLHVAGGRGSKAPVGVHGRGEQGPSCACAAYRAEQQAGHNIRDAAVHLGCKKRTMNSEGAPRLAGIPRARPALAV